MYSSTRFASYYVPLQRYKFPTRPGAPCLWHETQGRRFRNPDTWCDARRNRHSRSTSEALDGGLATGSGLVGRNTAAAANLHWCAQNNGNQYRSQWNGITGAIRPIFTRHMAPAHRSDYAIAQLLTEPPTTDRCQLQHCIATKRRTHARGTGMAEGRSYRPPRP